MEKKISYLARNFGDIKNELIDFSKKYYPELSDRFNDASVGAWMVDLVSAVGDDLSYHTDRMYQETNINSSNSRRAVMNNARMNGVKVPGPKSSVCEVELSCQVSVNPDNLAQPNFNEAPILKRGGIVGNSNYTFELTEDVDFSEQFNSDGYSNRKILPIRDNNGNINGYTLVKNTVVVSGRSKLYKKVINNEELTPFMEIVLPELNIMNVESVIFKETSNFNNDPKSFEFYIDEEEFKIKGEAVQTYRYFEVDSLSDQYRFGTKTKTDSDGLTVNHMLNKTYEAKEYKFSDKEITDLTYAKYYEGVWKPITQKYITEYTDNGYLKIIFGGGSDSNEELPSGGSEYAKNITSKIINNKMLGLLPKAGWTMFVLYRVGGGTETNLAVGAINTIISIDTVFPNTNNMAVKNNVIKSLSVTNPSPSVAGKDSPSVEELKYLIKYSIPSQERCVTLKDYKSRILMIPPKYGCPFRCNVMEENNKVVIPLLGLKPTGDLDSALPSILVDNLIEYLSNYKNLTDFVEFKSGRIYHLGFEVDVFIDKTYTTSDVVASIINTIKDYFSIDKHDMGEDIFVGDLEKELNLIDGVISLIDLKVFKVWGGTYSATPCPLPTVNSTSVCEAYASDFMIDGAQVEQIDLNAIDSVLYADYDSMYEVLNPEKDIKVRVKLR